MSDVSENTKAMIHATLPVFSGARNDEVQDALCNIAARVFHVQAKDGGLDIDDAEEELDRWMEGVKDCLRMNWANP